MRAGTRFERDAALDGLGAEYLEDGGLERRRVVGGGVVIGELAMLAQEAEDPLANRAGELVDVAAGELRWGMERRSAVDRRAAGARLRLRPIADEPAGDRDVPGAR